MESVGAKATFKEMFPLLLADKFECSDCPFQYLETTIMKTPTKITEAECSIAKVDFNVPCGRAALAMLELAEAEERL